MLCLLSAQFAAQGRVIRVPQDAATIQAGLDSLLDTDTLLVDRGVYEERVVLPPFHLTMIGLYDPDGGEMSRPIVDLSNSAVPDSTAVLSVPRWSGPTIENFRIIGGDRNGIRCWSTFLLLRNCVIDNCNEGFRQVQDSIGAVAEFENCYFRLNRNKCAIVRGGNELRAFRTVFEGGEGSSVMVSLSGSVLDSCIFTSGHQRTLLYSARESIVTNCTFGPCDVPFAEAVLLGDSLVVFTGNRVTDIDYGTHAIKLMLDNPDAATVTGNTFVDCRGHAGGLMGAGALAVVFDPAHATQGPDISQNIFGNNAGNSYCDDIAARVDLRMRVQGNRFERGVLNGLPSVGGSTSPWQETPIVLRGNVFSDCGYALRGTAQTDARSNFWGDLSGPYHEFENPQGLGDTLSGPAQFVPWLTDTSSGASGSVPQIADRISFFSWPNPFNLATVIRFELSKSDRVELAVFNSLGQRVATLLNERMAAGVHRAEFSAAELASGTYFCRLNAGEFASTMKMVLLK